MWYKRMWDVYVILDIENHLWKSAKKYTGERILLWIFVFVNPMGGFYNAYIYISG